MLVPVAAIALVGASDEAETETLRPAPPEMADDVRERFDDLITGTSVKDFDGKTVTLNEILRGDCRDRLDYAQNDKDGVKTFEGPLFQRKPGTADDPPLAIYAVDRRENGCGVMVVMGDLEDVRPLPKLGAEDYRLMPADGERED